ncbi:MAG TPA: helix-turn-helix domain-containing protein [Dictyobacter sp.]|nr:helix-turn-helix domain-containing protein [Dictyobacter sp.]
MARPRKEFIGDIVAGPTPSRLLDVDQAADWLGVSRTLVFEYIDRKGLPVIRLSERVVRFDPNSMYRWALRMQEGIA